MTCRCSKCGKFYSMKHTRREDDGRCFGCWFWHRRYMNHLAEPDRSFIVNGTAYMVGEEPKPGGGGFLGFGGAEFRIKPMDGRDVIISHNVWCQGDVDAIWRNLLPDNATFIEKNWDTGEWYE